MSCGVGRRCSLDLMLLRQGCRLATVPLIQPLAWEPQHAVGVALKKQKNKKKKKYKPGKDFKKEKRKKGLEFTDFT